MTVSEADKKLMKEKNKLYNEGQKMKREDAIRMAVLQDKLSHAGGNDEQIQGVNKMFLSPDKAFAKNGIDADDSDIFDYFDLTMDYTKSLIGDNNPNNMVQSYNFSKYGRGTRFIKEKNEYNLMCYDIDTIDENGFAVERELDTYVDATSQTVPVFGKNSKYQNGLISMFVGKIFGVGGALKNIKRKMGGDIKPACKKVKVQLRKPNFGSASSFHGVVVGNKAEYIFDAGEMKDKMKTLKDSLERTCQDLDNDSDTNEINECVQLQLRYERLKKNFKNGNERTSGTIISKNDNGTYNVELDCDPNGTITKNVPKEKLSTKSNPDGYNVNKPFNITYEDAYLSLQDMEHFYNTCTAQSGEYNPDTFASTKDYGKCLKRADGSNMSNSDIFNAMRKLKRKKASGVIKDNSITGILSNPMGYVKTGDSTKKVGDLKEKGGYESFSNVDNRTLNDALVIGQKVAVGGLGLYVLYKMFHKK